jgi:hypothetical protein
LGEKSEKRELMRLVKAETLEKKLSDRIFFISPR